jgi:transposase
MSRRTYSDEFKREAVALINAGHTVEQVAIQLGVPNGTLWNWVKGKNHRAVHRKPDGMTEEEWITPAAYQAARKRIADLERENEFLGKASADFAQKGHR